MRIGKLHLVTLVGVASLFACNDETISVRVVLNNTAPLDLDFVPAPQDPVEVGRLVGSGSAWNSFPTEVEDLDFVVTPSLPVAMEFRTGCYLLHASSNPALEIEHSRKEVDLSEENPSAYTRSFFPGERVILRSFIQDRFKLPDPDFQSDTSEEIDLLKMATEKDTLEVDDVGFNEEDLVLTFTCEINSFALGQHLSVAVEGVGDVRLESGDFSMNCSERSSPCALRLPSASAVATVAVDPVFGTPAFSGRLGFECDVQGSGPYTIGPGACMVTFDTWGVTVELPSDDLQLVTTGVQVDPSNPLRFIAPGSQGEISVSVVDASLVPVELTSATGSCRVGSTVGSLVLTKPTSGGSGTCAVGINDPPPDRDFKLDLGGSTQALLVSPPPSGTDDVACAPAGGTIACQQDGEPVAHPLVYAASTEVVIRSPSANPPAFEGDCQLRAPNESVVRLAPTTRCRVLETGELRASTDTDTGIAGYGQDLQCGPGTDTVDCDGDGEDDPLYFPVGEEVVLTPTAPSTFDGDCVATNQFSSSLIMKSGVNTCQIQAAAAPDDARLELLLGADAGEPASRILVLDPDSLAEVDRCSFDAESDFASRSCELTSLPRKMHLVPEPDGDGSVDYAAFLRFEGDCAAHVTARGNGYDVDIMDLIQPGEAPSVNDATCEAVFECTPEAVLETVDVIFEEAGLERGVLTVNVATDCTPVGQRYSCNLGQTLDLPEDVDLDVLTSVGGGSPGFFKSMLLGFTTLTQPVLRKSAGTEALQVVVQGCEHEYALRLQVE